MESKVDYRKMGLDPLVIPMVEFFNSRGLKTYMSCQGHESLRQSLFWIEFDKSVTEDAIVEFMWNHRTRFDTTEAPEKYRGKIGYDRWFISNGRIAERIMVGVEGQRIRSWIYVAASPDAALDDLITWRFAENCELYRGGCPCESCTGKAECDGLEMKICPTRNKYLGIDDYEPLDI